MREKKEPEAWALFTLGLLVMVIILLIINAILTQAGM